MKKDLTPPEIVPTDKFEDWVVIPEPDPDLQYLNKTDYSFIYIVGAIITLVFISTILSLLLLSLFPRLCGG